MGDSINRKKREDVGLPLFGSWQNAYIAVVAAFAVEVALFYLMSRYFA